MLINSRKTGRLHFPDSLAVGDLCSKFWPMEWVRMKPVICRAGDRISCPASRLFPFSSGLTESMLEMMVPQD